eukprot:6480164-Pyramimonas_sp.AAC.1
MIEDQLVAQCTVYSPSMELVNIGSGSSDDAEMGYYFPNNWRQTERELCKYNAASVAAMQDVGPALTHSLPFSRSLSPLPLSTLPVEVASFLLRHDVGPPPTRGRWHLPSPSASPHVALVVAIAFTFVGAAAIPNITPPTIAPLALAPP